MVLVENNNPFHLINYLTSKELQNYELMSRNLREFFEEALFSEDISNDCNNARLILDLYGRYDKWEQGSGEKVLLLLLKSKFDDSNVALRKLSTIFDAGLGDLFFSFATTAKTNFYAADELVEIIDLFHRLIELNPNSIPHSIPPFDQGGKECLLVLLDAKKQLALDVGPKRGLSFLLQNGFIKDFSSLKSDVIRYLGSLDAKYRLPIASYFDLIKYLETEKKDLHVIYKKIILQLVLVLTTKEEVKLDDCTTLNLRQLCDLIVQLSEFFGVEHAKWLSPNLYKDMCLGSCVKFFTLLKNIYVKSDGRNELECFLEKFSSNEISTCEMIRQLEFLELGISSLEFKEESTKILRDKFSGKISDSAITFPFPEELLSVVFDQYEDVQKYCSEFRSLSLEQLVSEASKISLSVKNSRADENAVVKLVAIGRLAIRLYFGIYLYNTQVIAALCELSYKNGVVAQVKTGEGKSKIVTLITLVLSLTRNTQGLIVSSSGYLAEREQEADYEFFANFKIKTSHICEENCGAHRFQGNVIYGTATDFEFAVMREFLYSCTLFPHSLNNSKKRFDWVIVDEVDNLTIDTSLSGARLSIRSEVRSDWVYAPIYTFAQKKLSSDAIPSAANLVDLREELKNYRMGKYAASVDKLSDKTLIAWMSSALKAIYQCKEKVDYVITREKKQRTAVIVDAKNTGRFMHGSRWSNGVHEFVEYKHDIEVRQESLCPISLSHPVFYDMCNSVYGITGTCGSSVERDELKQIYGLESFDVPTYRPVLRVDLPPNIYETDEGFYSRIEKIAKETIDKGSCLLLLCETIKDSEDLANRFKAQSIPFELLNEMQEKSEKEIVKNAGMPGAVTIATNTASRGTDIKLSSISLANGGLTVLLTFDPESERVEFQCRGRAGRQGQLGSSEIILSKEKLSRLEPSLSSMSNEEIVHHLKRMKELRAIKTKNLRLFHAYAEREVFLLVSEFYKKLNHFFDLVNGISYQDKIVALLNRRRVLNNNMGDYSALGRKNRQIVEEAVELLVTAGDSTDRWKTLIKKVIRQMRDEMIQSFAREFNEEVPAIIQNTYMQYEIALQRRFEILINHRNEEIFLSIGIKDIDKIQAQFQFLVKNEVHSLYKQKSSYWDRYLDESGKGVLVYLSRLIKFELTLLESDRW